MTADPGAIHAGIGVVQVLHRLALGVEPVDAFTRMPIGGGVRVGRELPRPRRRFRPGTGPLDPLARRRDLALEHNGTGRFKLRHGPGLGSAATVRIRVDDPWRRYVPRRFDVPIWTFDEVTASEDWPPIGSAPAKPPTGPFVATRSRLLRPWLLPGAAYSLPTGTTGLRGKVTRGGRPLPWPRVEAVLDDASDNVVLGQAHGDERGEFVVVIAGDRTAVPLPLTTVDILVLLYAPPPAQPPVPGAPPDPGALPADDPLAGLALEPVTRSSNPPVPGDLDNLLLRGETLPATYVASTTPPPAVTLEVGRVRSEPVPFPFTP
jgi:hypothetical protein